MRCFEAAPAVYFAAKIGFIFDKLKKKCYLCSLN